MSSVCKRATCTTTSREGIGDTMWSGILLAGAAAVCEGSFGVLMKLKPVQDNDVSAQHFTCWATVGVILSSLLLLPWADLSSLNWIGVISGVLFAASTGAAFIAISQLGIGVATALWGGTAVLASMIWDIRVNHHTKASNPDVAAGAVLVTVIGLAAVAVNGRYNEFLNQQRQEATELAVDSEDEELVLELVQERRLSEDRVMDPLNADAIKLRRLPSFGMALIAAVAAGICGGLVLAPRSFVHQKDIAYLVNMAAGAAVAAPVLTISSAIIQHGRQLGLPPAAALKVAAPFGIISGVVWFAGTICSILAADRVGLSISVPISQCGLLIAGLWSIFLFREMALQTVFVYLLAGCTLIAGAAMLAVGR